MKSCHIIHFIDDFIGISLKVAGYFIGNNTRFHWGISYPCYIFLRIPTVPNAINLA